MLLEPLTIGYHIVQYGIFHLKSIFSLFIALLRHWGPHATSINNKIFRNLINKHSWRVCNHYRYPISPTHFAVGAPRLNTGVLIPDQIYSPRTLQQTGEYVYWIDRRPYRKILLFWTHYCNLVFKPNTAQSKNQQKSTILTHMERWIKYLIRISTGRDISFHRSRQVRLPYLIQIPPRAFSHRSSSHVLAYEDFSTLMGPRLYSQRMVFNLWWVML